MYKIGAIIQARMGSSRLPGKVMINIKGKSVLAHVIERVQQCKRLDQIIIATTTEPEDDVVVKEAKDCGVSVYRGSSEDVLARYYEAAKNYDIETIIRITADCPLIDPQIVDEMILKYLGHNYEIVTNAGIDLSKRTYPRGLDCSVFSFHALREAYYQAQKYREHVTPYIFETSKSVRVYQNDVDMSKHRWTLDVPEDLMLIEKIYEYLYHGKHNFYMKDILALVNTYRLYEINGHIQQKPLKSIEHDPNI